MLAPHRHENGPGSVNESQINRLPRRGGGFIEIYSPCPLWYLQGLNDNDYSHPAVELRSAGMRTGPRAGGESPEMGLKMAGLL